MTKLKLGPITEEKPVKATLELPASLHRDLAAYAELLGIPTPRAALLVRVVPTSLLAC